MFQSSVEHVKELVKSRQAVEQKLKSQNAKVKSKGKNEMPLRSDSSLFAFCIFDFCI